MIDILYIIGPLGPNFALEAMCSLRTMQKYVPDVGRVFITGRCPEFINKGKVIFTPEEDIGCPMINHWWKVKQTIEKTDIGEIFVLMYDDIFFTKPTKLTKYPFYNKGLLGESKEGGQEYQKCLDMTKKWLEKNNKTIYDHELHIPCIYEREKFKELTPIFEKQKRDEHAMAVRSIYGNLFEVNTPKRTDVKIRAIEDTENSEIMNAECISTSDYTFPFIAAPYLNKHVKKRSKWEK